MLCKEIPLVFLFFPFFLIFSNIIIFYAERARLQAEAKAAEDARRRAEEEAAAEAKRKREQEREAARQALLQVTCIIFLHLPFNSKRDVDVTRACLTDGKDSGDQ